MPRQGTDYFKKYHQKNKAKRNAQSRANHQKNKARYAVSKRKYYEENEEKITTKNRNCHLKNKYGIDLQQYEQLLVEQEYRCAICKKHASEVSTALAVDHCHKTGKVRGLLCGSCNRGLGLLRDDYDLLLVAAEYIKQANV